MTLPETQAIDKVKAHLLQLAKNGPIPHGTLKQLLKSFPIGLGELQKVYLELKKAGVVFEPTITQSPKTAKGEGDKDVLPMSSLKKIPGIIVHNGDVLNALDDKPPHSNHDILPAGLIAIAGRPKTGKSWFALDMALAMARGADLLGQQIQQFPTLYIGLEDSARRLKDRCQKILSATTIPNGLHWQTKWPRADAQGIDMIYTWLAENPTAHLVIIDTWIRFRPMRKKGADWYEEDTAMIDAVQQLLVPFPELSIVLLTHTRKFKDTDDPLNDVSGSTGITGAADVVMVLQRERCKNDAKLFVTGRDIGEREIFLTWNKPAWRFELSNDPDAGLTPPFRKVRQYLRKQNRDCTTGEIAEAIAKSVQATTNQLTVMESAGLITKPAYGKWGLQTEPV